jgi:hypothetical protein
MIAHLNCGGCHRIKERDARIAQFLERKNMVPPTLDGVGARLQGLYLFRFLLEPKQERPWLKMRMPKFGLTDAQARLLVEGFAAVAGDVDAYAPLSVDAVAQGQFDRGIRRFRHYKCVQCHPTSIDQGLPPDVDPEDLSINLMLTKARLRPEWIKEFMARPKQMAGAQTRMPTVFYSVEGEPKVEKPQQDIEDITAYMMWMAEPPEITLAAMEQKDKTQEQQVDWTKIEY